MDITQTSNNQSDMPSHAPQQVQLSISNKSPGILKSPEPISWLQIMNSKFVWLETSHARDHLDFTAPTIYLTINCRICSWGFMKIH